MNYAEIDDLFDIYTASSILEMNEEDKINFLNKMDKSESDKIHKIITAIKNEIEINNNMTSTLLTLYYAQIKHRNKDVLLHQKINLEMNKVEIKTSNIKGDGVFAKKDIQIGEIITFYPADMLVDKNNNISLYNNKYTLDEIKIKEMSPYMIYIDCDQVMIGHPTNKDNMTYVGHMINDGVKITKNMKTEYYREMTFQTANCTFDKILCMTGEVCTIAIKAIKNISKGEELHIEYGYNYWIGGNKLFI